MTRIYYGRTEAEVPVGVDPWDYTDGGLEPEDDLFDNTQAMKEGWDLFEVDGRLMLQRIDHPSDHAGILDYDEPKFNSDADAIIHVALEADAGSEYHRNAIELIGYAV